MALEKRQPLPKLLCDLGTWHWLQGLSAEIALSLILVMPTYSLESSEFKNCKR